ncbi:MAG TPA: hypothetical protein ENI27_07545 [bacterium]|nr:hypothetical protein [bacterium]
MVETTEKIVTVVSHNGDSCPHCGSHDTTPMSQDNEDLRCIKEGWVEGDMRCTDCGATWNDVYRIVGYRNLKAPVEEKEDE